MRALILTAGLGTRLRPLTLVRAKAAVPVNGEPMVRRVIAWLVSQGFADLVLNLHHRPASIAAVVGDGGDLGARVRYSWENPLLGSAGGPRRALPLLIDQSPRSGADSSTSTFVLVNGDTLTNFSVPAMLETHRSSGALVTMALIRNPRPYMYGGVVVEQGRVRGFTRAGAARETYHFIGVQAAEARVFSPLDEGVPSETVMQVYPELINRDSRAIAAHIVEAPFRDVGTPAEYLQTSMELADREGDHLVSGDDVAIDASATLVRTAVWDHVRIGALAHLEDCIVCDGAAIPDGARYARCAIVPHRGTPPNESERVEDQLLIRPF